MKRASSTRIAIRPSRITTGLLIIGLGLAAGCGKREGAGGPPAGGPPEVAVVTVTPEAVTLSDELPGRVSAFLVAEVRPQVSGIIQKRLFEEGADVKAGDPLYQIDPAVYEANLAAARATLARAEANLTSMLIEILPGPAGLRLGHRHHHDGGGRLAIYNLPISQYPPIAPPSIAIDAFYPGASAETVENSVTQIIEQKMTGFDKMLYMSGHSDSAGASRIELTFKPGTDPDLAWARCRTSSSSPWRACRTWCSAQGVKVSKSTRNYLIIVGSSRKTAAWTATTCGTTPSPTSRRCWRGCRAWARWRPSAAQYAMRVWLNPDKLTDYQPDHGGCDPALRAYNVEVSAGQFGGAPAVPGQR
jgi:hypothetical protein